MTTKMDQGSAIRWIFWYVHVIVKAQPVIRSLWVYLNFRIVWLVWQSFISQNIIIDCYGRTIATVSECDIFKFQTR